MSQSSLVELVFAGVWLVKSGNGEYLDVTADGDAARLTTVPASRVRHAFRLQRVQDLRTREWSVALEPVLLGRAPVAAAASTRVAAATPLRLPMHLRHHGCLNFELTLPPPHERSKLSLTTPALIAGGKTVDSLAERLPSEGRALSLALDLATVALTPSTVNFPTFEGDALRAFNFISGRLGFDPHGDSLDEAALSRLKRPDDIPANAWDEVTSQLLQEIHYRFLCGGRFGSLREFVQNVFIANASLVETVGSLIKLDGGELFHMIVGGVFSAIAQGVGALPFPGAGVVGGALSVAFKVMLRDRGPGEAELTVALCNARQEMSTLFESLITAVKTLRENVFNDWGKLKEMGEALQSDPTAKWPNPDDESAMRRETCRLLEISLWKSLLKVKWHHMTSDDDPGFLTKYSDADAAGYEAANPNYWVQWWPGTETTPLGKETSGYRVAYHWLGYGSNTLWHHEPDTAMCQWLFDKLKVPRKEVFTDASWALTPEVFHMDHPPAPGQ